SFGNSSGCGEGSPARSGVEQPTPTAPAVARICLRVQQRSGMLLVLHIQWLALGFLDPDRGGLLGVALGEANEHLLVLRQSCLPASSTRVWRPRPIRTPSPS